MSGDNDPGVVMEEVRQEMRFLLRDIRGLREDIDGLRREVRQEIVSLRTDMATMINSQNAAIESNKKKSPSSLPELLPSMGGSRSLRNWWPLSAPLSSRRPAN